MAGLRAARRLINTAAFDPNTRTVVGRGPIQPLATEDGYEALRGYEDGLWQGVYNGRTAAYPAGDRAIRRHELFHGLVDKAADDPSLNVSPTVNALASARRMLGDSGPLAGARDITEELFAHAVGGQYPKTLSQLLKVSPYIADYARLYHSQSGLGNALPLYAASVATHPATVAGGLVGGGMLAYGLNAPEEATESGEHSLDRLIERLGQ
jgi:hypothetical protein